MLIRVRPGDGLIVFHVHYAKACDITHRILTNTQWNRPDKIQRLAVGEKSPGDAVTLTDPGIIKRLRVPGFAQQDGLLSLCTETLPLPLSIPEGNIITFGTELIAAIEYFRRVIESDDMINDAIRPQADGVFPVKSFWIRKEKLTEVNRLAAAGELPDAEITDELLKIKPLAKSVPEEAERLEEDIFGVMPRQDYRTAA